MAAVSDERQICDKTKQRTGIAEHSMPRTRSHFYLDPLLSLSRRKCPKALVAKLLQAWTRTTCYLTTCHQSWWRRHSRRALLYVANTVAVKADTGTVEQLNTIVEAHAALFNPFFPA